MAIIYRIVCTVSALLLLNLQSAHCQTDTTETIPKRGILEPGSKAWLAGINNSAINEGSITTSIAWKKITTDHSALRFGLYWGGTYSQSDDEGETEQAGRISSELSNSHYAYFPIQFSLVRQNYMGNPAAFRFYWTAGGGIDFAWTTNKSESGDDYTFQSENWAFGAGPVAGIGMEWFALESISFFIENQIYLRLRWTIFDSERHYLVSNERFVRAHQETTGVTFGLTYTKLGAAFYFD